MLFCLSYKKSVTSALESRTVKRDALPDQSKRGSWLRHIIFTKPEPPAPFIKKIGGSLLSLQHKNGEIPEGKRFDDDSAKQERTTVGSAASSCAATEEPGSSCSASRSLHFSSYSTLNAIRCVPGATIDVTQSSSSPHLSCYIIGRVTDFWKPWRVQSLPQVIQGTATQCRKSQAA